MEYTLKYTLYDEYFNDVTFIKSPLVLEIKEKRFSQYFNNKEKSILAKVLFFYF